MEKSSPRFQYQDAGRSNYQSLIPSPNSTSSSSSSNSSSSPTSTNGLRHSTAAAAQPPPPPPSLPSPRPIARSESANPYPTTFVQADTSSFKQVVQMLTGSPKSAAAAASPQPDPTHHRNHNHHPMKSHNHAIPPIKPIPKRNQSSGFKLYERRNSLKNLKINPLNPFLSPAAGSGFSPRKPEILSPSILDFPSLVLSPVTPLIHDPFDRSGSGTGGGFATCYGGSPMNGGGGGNHQPASKLGDNNSSMMVDSAAAAEAEQKAIKEKGFYLHASPATTPREAEPPRLLPLFPVTSPRVSGSD